MTDRKTKVSKQGGQVTRPGVDVCRPALDTRPVVDLLASILSEVHKQVASNAPPPLDGDAVQAIQLFREIRAALGLKPAPRIFFKAEPSALPVGGGVAKLTWTSTDAQAVVIDQTVGEVTPTAGGSVAVNVLTTTTFTATAVNPCGSATAPATVTVATVV